MQQLDLTAWKINEVFCGKTRRLSLTYTVGEKTRWRHYDVLSDRNHQWLTDLHLLNNYYEIEVEGLFCT